MFAAFAVRSRMIERFGDRAEHAWSFPTRERIASAREEELVELGFSRRKAEYVVSLARSELDFEELRELPDEEVQGAVSSDSRPRRVDAPTGSCARYLARPRAWPAGDLALQKAVVSYYGDAGFPCVRRPVRAVPEPERPLPADRRSNGGLVSDCVFCELIAGRGESSVVYEDETLVALHGSPPRQSRPRPAHPEAACGGDGGPGRGIRSARLPHRHADAAGAPRLGRPLRGRQPLRRRRRGRLPGRLPLSPARHPALRGGSVQDLGRLEGGAALGARPGCDRAFACHTRDFGHEDQAGAAGRRSRHRARALGDASIRSGPSRPIGRRTGTTLPRTSSGCCSRARRPARRGGRRRGRLCARLAAKRAGRIPGRSVRAARVPAARDRPRAPCRRRGGAQARVTSSSPPRRGTSRRARTTRGLGFHEESVNFVIRAEELQ